MNRAEKRKHLAKAKKKAEFAKQLTPVQKEYINELVELTKQNTMLQMADIFDKTYKNHKERNKIIKRKYRGN